MCLLVFQRIICNGIRFSAWIAKLKVMIVLMVFKARGACNTAFRSQNEISIAFSGGTKINYQ